MTVAADIKNMDGMLLIPVGSVLSERQINILQSWGVVEVDVEACQGAEEPTDPLAKLSGETVQRLTEETKALFWETDDTNPVFSEILKQLLLRRARKMVEQA